MLSITIPMWVFFAVAGLPTLILLALSVRLMRLKRYRNKVQSEQEQETLAAMPDRFGKQMNQMILEQQIDAVFNALMTILESERMKLKALVYTAPSSQAPIRSVQTSPLAVTNNDQTEEMMTGNRTQDERPSIAELVAGGMSPEDIARRLGLSKTEVTLALKMKAGRRSGRGQRLEAVA